MAIPKIIALVTLKGGSGKSTLAACLAVHWHARGETAALIDADPRESLAALRDPKGPVGALELRADPTEKVSEVARALARHHRPVIIDTPGARNRTSTEALTVADLALVPLKPSPLDVKAALETRRFIEEINAGGDRAGHPIVTRFILTMTTPGDALAYQVRTELAAAGLKLLQAEMAARDGYAEAIASGVPPTIADPNGAAAHDISAIAHEIEALGG